MLCPLAELGIKEKSCELSVIKVSGEKFGGGSLLLSAPFLENAHIIRKQLLPNFCLQITMFPLPLPLGFMKNGGFSLYRHCV